MNGLIFGWATTDGLMYISVGYKPEFYSCILYMYLHISLIHGKQRFLPSHISG